MPDAPKPSTPLDPRDTTRLTEFARACRAAARAVSLYPGAHPAIRMSLSRLVDAASLATAAGVLHLQVRAHYLLLGGKRPERPDPALTELAELLHRHLIGGLVIHGGTDAESWRVLLSLLSRTPEDVVTEGGIAYLWASAGGPSIEIEEIDYAEVLRDRHGEAAELDAITEACRRGTATLEWDEATLEVLRRLIQDPERLATLVSRLVGRLAGEGPESQGEIFLRLAKGLAELVSQEHPERFDAVFGQLAVAAGGLGPPVLAAVMSQRRTPDAQVGPLDVVGAVAERMTDDAIAQFVAGSVIEERGASERLAEAFQALVPEIERQRQLLSLAGERVSESPLGSDESFTDLWDRVENMLTSYSDRPFVSDDYAHELSSVRMQAVDVEQIGDDPPERIATWVSTVNDAALRSLDLALLLDLLDIEEDSLRWRDIAETVVSHIEDLVRVGNLQTGCDLADRLATEAESGATPERRAQAAEALERLGRGRMLRYAAAQLHGVDDQLYERFKHACHAIGPSVIPGLAEALAAEKDARIRRRLRDVLVGFGVRGRASVQQLMNAENWEVRRTAAFLLSEFGAADTLDALESLLKDSEPLVRREAVQVIVMSGNERAYELLLRALTADRGRSHETLVEELVSLRDERASPLFCYLVRRLDRRAMRQLYTTAIDGLGTFGGPDAVDPLKDALYKGEWWAPFRTRALRHAAADALRRIGTPEALDMLRDASGRGPRGVRAAARAQLERITGGPQ